MACEYLLLSKGVVDYRYAILASIISETYRRKRDAASESDVADNEVHQSLGEEVTTPLLYITHTFEN